ncbi:MAG: exodeoxyribonuclease VII small subunit [Negativicutes bacterium]|nr:exodeoxyribonuclease VII small subunit [Negativicutes bacterium]
MKKKSSPRNQSEQTIAHVSFEDALGKLEVIVKELERGDLPLEEALEQFAAGVTLTQVCLAKLNAADREIDKILREEKGEIVEYPLELQEEE